MAGSSRVLRKLETSLKSGEYYEAHQMYRTLYFRYLSQQKYSELIELMYDASLKFLDLGQTAIGTDLSELFVEALQHSKTDITESILLKLEKLFSKIPPSVDEVHHSLVSTSAKKDQHVDRSKFMDGALKWSKEMSDKKEYKERGHPGLHQKLASVFWTENKYPQARYHFMLSNDGEGCASFLIEYQSRCGYGGEVDLFVAQAVLQYLCYKNKDTANLVFVNYTHQHPLIGDGPPFVFPLLNFLWLLLLCVDLRRVTYYSALVEHYQPSIKRDPCYTMYLDKIGQLFFGFPPPRRDHAGGGFIANIIQGIMGGEETASGDEMEEDEYHSIEESPSPSTSPMKSTKLNGPVNMKLKDEDLD